jgi:hypothetical protein
VLVIILVIMTEILVLPVLSTLRALIENRDLEYDSQNFISQCVDGHIDHDDEGGEYGNIVLGCCRIPIQ